MSDQGLIEMLEGIDLFSGLPEPVLSDLVGVGSAIHTPAGHPAVTQGSDDAGLQVVTRGSAVVEVNGVRRPGELGPGDYFGEVSVLDGRGRSATIIAGEDGLDTFTVSPLRFWPLVERHPALTRSLIGALSARIRELDNTPNADTC